nr:hypothetical protein JVH1_3923 [Rhodococcus sp. JVH1]
MMRSSEVWGVPERYGYRRDQLAAFGLTVDPERLLRLGTPAGREAGGLRRRVAVVTRPACT